MPVWLTTTWKLLDALMSIPGLLSAVSAAAEAVTLWYIQKQQAENLAKIADAAAFAAQAQTDEERYIAAEKWRCAFSQPRISK